MYVEYYGNHKGIAPHTHKPRHPMLKFQTKTVVFDFDGTITMSTNGMTTWEMIWTHLGYKITDCAEYHTQYRRNLITHEEWCNITLDRFRIKRFSSKMLSEIAGNVKLIPGLPETIDDLTARGIKIYILSGSIRELIRIVLGDLSSSFEQIKANEMKFDKEGIIQDIIGTKYDFEGKDEYIRNLVRQENCSPMDILFVGNAGNDEWASKSGARTLCVNPSSTDPDNPKIWTENIRKVSDLRDILKHTL
jgi:HAD superfamily phosphoserine phosphatase-like hydrolase